ncbi:MAG TPA: peptide chain release factor N(5)-glutamine methyltransferase [Xanthobacteraceae bacterium]|jgi:release factor glutamine methyltransferase|nr:peptide chain release factor N(5)-glutamine methyltransferase [Xanthobacteraceae bacterium]
MQADATSAAAPQSAPDVARTIDEIRRFWAAAFAAADLDSPQLDARLLVGHALGLDHTALLADGARRLDSGEERAIAALAQRRLAHEPVARIVGTKEFWSLDLGLNEATLVPRPETETVVEAALAAVDRYGSRTRPLRIADLGTGSGAILLALLSELKNARGVGCDISFRALAMARDNALRLQRSLALRERALFVACDLATALRGPFDLIVSNPPYIASGDIAALPPEVCLFDPRLALDGGTDGLDFYRAIAAAAPSLLAPNGAVAVEVGAHQAEPVAAIFAAVGLVPLTPRPDVYGIPRAVVALRNRGSEERDCGA